MKKNLIELDGDEICAPVVQHRNRPTSESVTSLNVWRVSKQVSK